MSKENSELTSPGQFQVFQDAVSNGDFILQQCKDCGQHVFYPRALCNHCGSKALKWVEASGKGKVYSTSIVRQKPEKGGDYNVTLIDLEEGPRMMSRVVGIESEKIVIGMDVIAQISSINEKPAIVFSTNETGEEEW